MHEGLRLYKDRIREHLAKMTPFYPLGLPPSIADTTSPVAVGLRDAERAFVTVWRLAGPEKISVAIPPRGNVSLLFPIDLGIKLEAPETRVELYFPRPYMAAIFEVKLQGAAGLH